MKPGNMGRLLLLGTAGCLLTVGIVSAQEAKPAAGKTEEVIVGRTEADEMKRVGLKLQVPASWEKEENLKSKLRLAQFNIPAVKGEKGPLELTIFSFGGGGGGVQANVERWVNQFDSDGRVAGVKRGESKQGPYVFVDIQGTFNMTVGPPIAGKTEKVPNARMLGVIIGVPDTGVFYLKLAGPEESVKAQLKNLRTAFGASDKEEEIPLKSEADSAPAKPDAPTEDAPKSE